MGNFWHDSIVLTKPENKMKIDLTSDFPITDDAVKAATGKTFSEWFAVIEAEAPSKGRRDVIQHLYDLMGRGSMTWWATTVWVEYERSKGVVNKKDGLAEGYNICVTKTIAASPDAVYAAFTEAGKNDWLQAGAAQEGSEFKTKSGNEGTWLRLRPGKDVRLAWQSSGVPHRTTVDATFADKGAGKTGITLIHARIQTREEADGLRNAWGAAFDELKRKLES